MYLYVIISILDSLCDIIFEFVDRNSYLFHSVSVTNGNAVVLKRIEVYGYAERSSDLVLTTVSLADRSAFVVCSREFLGKIAVEFFGFFAESLFLQGQYGNFIRCDKRMQVHYHTTVSAFEFLFFVSVAEQSEHHSLYAERRFDNVGYVFFTGIGIGVFHIFTADFSVSVEVEIGTVCDTPKFAPTEGEFEFEVGGCVGVVREFLGIVVTEFKTLLFDAETQQPVFAELFPVCEPFEVGTGLAEELEFHLFEFSYSEYKVSGSDFVTERFTDLTDTERNFHTGGTLYVEEVYEDTLCRFGTEIYGIRAVLGNALESLEHKIELSYAGKIALAAVRAGNFVVGDIFFHLFVGPTCNGKIEFFTVDIVLDEVVCTVSRLTAFAVHERIGKSAYVSRSYPDVGVHKYSAVKSRVEGVFLYEFFPPSTLDIVFEFYTERTVVPSVSKTAVDFAAGKDETSALAKSNEFIHS